jgi:hypothetical protein
MVCKTHLQHLVPSHINKMMCIERTLRHVGCSTFHILLILMLMASWHAEVLDVKGAILHGLFEEGEQIHMGIPEGFEQCHGANYVLSLLRTLCGLKQAVFAFWKELLKAFRSMEHERSKADPCLCFAWTALGLVLRISWVDDCLAVGKKEAVMKAKAQMTVGVKLQKCVAECNAGCGRNFPNRNMEEGPGDD